MKNARSRKNANQPTTVNPDEKKLMNKLALKNQTGKILSTFAHKHTFHHGPLLNTRRPHVPHG